MKNGKGERIGGELEGSRLQCKMRQTRQNSLFFPNEKERTLCKKKRRGEKEGGGGERGGGVFDLFSKVL